MIDLAKLACGSGCGYELSRPNEEVLLIKVQNSRDELVTATILKDDPNCFDQYAARFSNMTLILETMSYLTATQRLPGLREQIRLTRDSKFTQPDTR